MARARNIKPSFFDNDALAEIDPLGRLLFIGLWTLADGQGKLEYRPVRIKKQILGYDDCDIVQLLNALEKSGFIEIYLDDSSQKNHVIRIPTFTKHQNPHKNELAKGSQWGDPQEGVNESNNDSLKAPESGACSDNREKSRLIETNPDEYHTDPAESLLLNPESLLRNPELNTMSGTPDHAPQDQNLIQTEKPKRKPSRPHRDDAAELLGYLNDKTGRNFESVDSNLKLIESILKTEGRTPELVRQVIDDRVDAWGSDPKMSQYLRPQTLFRESKFSQYVGNLSKNKPPGYDCFSGFENIDYNQGIGAF